MTDKPKSLGPGLEIKTLRGGSSVSYLVFRTGDGAFHVFREVEPREAARDCGAKTDTDGRDGWETFWQKLQK